MKNCGKTPTSLTLTGTYTYIRSTDQLCLYHEIVETAHVNIYNFQIDSKKVRNQKDTPVHIYPLGQAPGVV